MELGFRIAINSGIPDSGFLKLYSGFQSPELWISQVKIFRILNFLTWVGSLEVQTVQFLVRNDCGMKTLYKMRLFEVNIPVTNLLTGLFSIVYFQISGAFLLPLVPETFHAQFPVSVKSL